MCFLLQDPSQLFKRRIRAASTATGASVYNPSCSIIAFVFLYFGFFCGPLFHAPCDISGPWALLWEILI